MERQRGSDPKAAAETSRYLGIGLTSGLSTLLFLWLGTIADRRLGTGPWLTLAGAFVGAAAGFYHMYHHLVIVPRNRKNQDDRADR